MNLSKKNNDNFSLAKVLDSQWKTFWTMKQHPAWLALGWI